jgi:hypothetical protein
MAGSIRTIGSAWLADDGDASRWDGDGAGDRRAGEEFDAFG